MRSKGIRTLISSSCIVSKTVIGGSKPVIESDSSVALRPGFLSDMYLEGLEGEVYCKAKYQIWMHLG